MSSSYEMGEHFPSRDAGTLTADPTVLWVTCGWCWGQRQTWEWNKRAECLTPTTCPTCLGLGEIATRR
jgi:uncharacterized Fe-S cluster-containing radical SAM superfamily protein